MVYIENFTIPSRDMQDSFFWGQDDRLMRTCYTDFYPFRVFDALTPEVVAFAPLTVFYGGNGSGKTTLLNVIAETLKVERGTVYNRSNFFPDYIGLCQYKLSGGLRQVPDGSRIITSDDVFDFLLDLRCMNSNIDNKRDALLDEYTETKYATFRFRSMEDYDRLRQINLTRRKSGSQYVKANLMPNLREQSNGESAFMYFTQAIKENGLYLLDEPENSLSAEMQLKLLEFLGESARFFNCQFIISTHSPFLLSMKDAVIYDLDEIPMRSKKWTELRNVHVYRDFFRKHNSEFDEQT